MNSTYIFPVLLIPLLLSACGGGSGESATATTNNRAPIISGTSASSVDEGQSYSFTPVADDADGDSLSFSISNLPAWASFNSSSGTISGTPDFDSAGDYTNITISVSDGSVSTSLPPFTLSVVDVNRAPTITGQPPSTVLVGDLYRFTPAAVDEDGDSLDFSISNLPAWASFNTSSGLLSGAPGVGDVGTSTAITIRVSDGTQSVSLSGFSITVTASVASSAGNIFVDQLIGANYCADYDEALRSCGGGDKEAYKSLASAAAVASAGDVVELRSGSFSEQFSPQKSGNASSPITYRAYNNENVVITGSSLSPAIVLSNRSYLVIEGLEISNVQRWMYAINAHHNIIRNNQFSGANDSGGSSKTGLFFQEATYNMILDNVIDDSTQDNIALIKSDNNLVANNTVTNAAHTLWAIKCGNRNVIRNNYFYNPGQKIGEIYDCDDVGFNHEFFIRDATKFNLVENNVFAKTSSYYSPSGGNGIQYSAQNGIIRFNIFYENNVGVGMQYYSPEALYNYANRIYHNTFYDNMCGGVSTSDPSTSDYSDNLFVNNIFYKNHECGGVSPFQLVYRNGLGGFLLDTNNLSSGVVSDDVIGEWQGSGNTLAWYEANYPGLFANNRESDPQFIDESNYDFRLNSSSASVDSGRFLANTRSSGSGTTIPVDDAGFFYDGFGIEDEVGDLVRLEGGSETFRIVSVDYASNEITVDQPATWSAGQGISHDYIGLAPDLGAHESY